ncbi:MAG TPA: hypothetical protein VJX74_18015 [Blastocatellia bacterium]|nr:hypothetical protein [Blastocatellia bacterium]
MRIAGLVLGILGGLAAGFLGMKWLSDANSMKELVGAARNLGVDMTELDKTITAAYILLGSAVLGIVGGVMAFKGKGKIAGLLMLIGAIAPAIFAPKALVFTCILLIGGIVSFFAKPAADARATGMGA